ncbi:MAG: glycine betaine ABC transporter substrate-binding protein [Pseudomonadota bacterium]
MKRLTLSAAALGLAIAAGTAGAQERVMIGEPSWPGARIMANLIGQVIETRLGGEVAYAPGANAVIFAAMDGGRGDIDVHPDVWLPNQQSFVDQYGANVTLSEGSYEGRSGFCVPTYMAEQHNIKTVFDLATPEAQALFDSDGDGMGEIWVGASGWASTNVHQVKVRDYGIGTFLTPTTEDETVYYSRLRDLVENQEGAVFYCYRPHYVHALYDVTMIEEPEYDPALYKMVAADQSANWFEESSIMTGDEVKTVRIAFSNSLQDRNPAAAAFLGAIDMDAGELSALTFEVVEKGAEIDAAVSAWIDANGDMIDGWLGLN